MDNAQDNRMDSSSGSESPPAEADRKRLAAELETKEREHKELYDRYLRTVADFENYKKRTAREQIEFSKFSNEKLLKELLPVLDNFDRALAHAREAVEKSTLIEGMELIHRQFLDALSKFGVQALQSEGKPFDPHFHQAVTQDGGEGEGEPWVTAEAQKGYLLHERLLRPALVAVSKQRKGRSADEESRLKEGPEQSLKDKREDDHA